MGGAGRRRFRAGDRHRAFVVLLQDPASLLYTR
jgi:hypothetical protein